MREPWPKACWHSFESLRTQGAVWSSAAHPGNELGPPRGYGLYRPTQSPGGDSQLALSPQPLPLNAFGPSNPLWKVPRMTCPTSRRGRQGAPSDTFVFAKRVWPNSLPFWPHWCPENRCEMKSPWSPLNQVPGCWNSLEDLFGPLEVGTFAPFRLPPWTTWHWILTSTSHQTSPW